MRSGNAGKNAEREEEGEKAIAENSPSWPRLIQEYLCGNCKHIFNDVRERRGSAATEAGIVSERNG